MMTIEKRANKYSAKYRDRDTGWGEYTMSKLGYLAGAREQKKIDDELITKLKESWEKESAINHDAAAHYKQGWHDAVELACEWLNNATTTNNHQNATTTNNHQGEIGCDTDYYTKSEFLEAFRKYMDGGK